MLDKLHSKLKNGKLDIIYIDGADRNLVSNELMRYQSIVGKLLLFCERNREYVRLTLAGSVEVVTPSHLSRNDAYRSLKKYEWQCFLSSCEENTNYVMFPPFAPASRFLGRFISITYPEAARILISAFENDVRVTSPLWAKYLFSRERVASSAF